jgi:predicted nucleic acid-binding protein
MIVADASPLICLSKIGRLRLLRHLYNVAAIGPVVKEEVVVRGRAIRAAEVRHVEKGLHEKWIREIQPDARERSLTARILRSTNLDEGEAQSLALAKNRRLAVVLDDKEARLMADLMSVEYLGTAGVLLKASVQGHLTYDELEAATGDLARVMWLSPDVVTEILRTAREVRR